jgi:hypothetical protein
MGLNHMNGRVQDAILGRFLSPDVGIPNPASSQSYNPYTYVNNNPLTLVDPTGFRAGLMPGVIGGGANFGYDGLVGTDAASPTTTTTSTTVTTTYGDGSQSSFVIPGDTTVIGGSTGSMLNNSGSGSSMSGSGPSINSPSPPAGATGTAAPSSQDTAQAAPGAGDQDQAQSGAGGFGSDPGFAGSSIDEVSEIVVTAQAQLSGDFSYQPAVFGGVSTWTRLGSISHRGLLLALVHRNPSLAGRLRADVQVPGGGFIDLLLDNQFAYELKPWWWQYGGDYISAMNQLAGYLSAGGYTAGTWAALGLNSTWVGITGNFSLYGINYSGGFVYGYDQANSASGLIFYQTSPGGTVTYSPGERGFSGGLSFGP